MINTLLNIFSLLFLIVLISCDKNSQSNLDLSNVAKRDQDLYKQTFNGCKIKNNYTDCNCVAKINIEHRSEIYESYIKNYESIHRPKQQMEITKRRITLSEKSKNLSDERVLEALEDDLRRLENSLASGPNNISEFNLYILPKGKTDVCVFLNP